MIINTAAHRWNREHIKHIYPAQVRLLTQITICSKRFKIVNSSWFVFFFTINRNNDLNEFLEKRNVKHFVVFRNHWPTLDFFKLSKSYSRKGILKTRMTRINNFRWLKRTTSKPFKYLCDAFVKTAKNWFDLLSSVEEIRRKAKF